MLARETPFLEDLRIRMMLPATEPYKDVAERRKQKEREIEKEFFATDAMTNREWTSSNQPQRHAIIGLATHDFVKDYVAKQLEAMTQLGQVEASSIDSLREAMGVMQHHDAITGTEKQHVAEDYMRILTNAFEDARGSAEKSLNQLISQDASNNVEVFNCLELNVSSCDVTENQEKFVVTVYNPLSHEVNHFVRLPVPSATYTVQAPDGALQTTQMVPIPKEVLESPERASSTATHDLVFKAENLPSLGFRSYYVTKTSDSFEEVQPSGDLSIGTDLEVVLDETTGLVKTLRSNGVEIPVAQNLYFYKGAAADNQRASGAYIFRPNGTSKTAISDSSTFVVYKGDVVDEIHQTFSDWASQVVRVYHEENHVEFEWLVGPIPTEYDNAFCF
ncbi:hypothetical protein ANN_15453 [Periplaneta americana]|uniref:Glycoside hydrolase family 38 central domain-containing protein n=1 Tax=Periplaneta americana TaxID=6978 RepID=A0ABQ8SGF5_PERAM|nr:hypothetical protein ANN_15453 [Periplaneta americana]